MRRDPSGESPAEASRLGRALLQKPTVLSAMLGLLMSRALAAAPGKRERIKEVLAPVTSGKS